MDTAVERHLAAAVEEVIANISNSFEQLVSPIMTKVMPTQAITSQLLLSVFLEAPPATLLPPARR